jgi:hypothetical protein
MLTWLPQLPSVAVVNRVAGVLAGSSLYIYLVQWQVYPHIEPHSRLLAVLASLAAGVALGAVMERAARRLPRRVPWRGRPPRVVPRPTPATLGQ